MMLRADDAYFLGELYRPTP